MTDGTDTALAPTDDLPEAAHEIPEGKKFGALNGVFVPTTLIVWLLPSVFPIAINSLDSRNGRSTCLGWPPDPCVPP